MANTAAITPSWISRGESWGGTAGYTATGAFSRGWLWEGGDDYPNGWSGGTQHVRRGGVIAKVYGYAGATGEYDIYSWCDGRTY